MEVCEKSELIAAGAAPKSAMLDMFQNRSKSLDVLIKEKMKYNRKLS